jgi:hypothetical protein
MARSAPSAALALLVLCSAPRALAGQRDGSGAFVLRDVTSRVLLGMERYTRAANRLQGVTMGHQAGVEQQTSHLDSTGACSHRVFTAEPVTFAVWYRAELRRDGSLAAFEVGLDSTFSTSVAVEMGGDSATLRARGGTTPVRLAVPAPVIPMAPSIAMFEQAVIHARALGRDSVEFAMLDVDHLRIYPMSVVRLGGDTVRLNTINGPVRLQMDERGRLLSLDPRGSDLVMVVSRVRSPGNMERFYAAALADDAAWRARPQPAATGDCAPAP